MEDDRRLSRTLRAALEPWARDVRCRSTVAGARSLLREWHPELLVLDVKLPDGTAHDLLRWLANRHPVPATVAISAYAGPNETFELAEHGVRVYLHKPLNLAELEGALDRALRTPPDVMPHVRQAVGHIGLKELEASVRSEMITEALGKAGGSLRGAARLLSTSRQLLQHAWRTLTS